MKQADNSNKEHRRQVGVLNFIIGAKGVFKAAERFKAIFQRYGLSPKKMENALNLFLSILSEYQCSATFPTPAVVVRRYAELLRKYQAAGIEFALHGLNHIDYSQLTLAEQNAELGQAKAIFSSAGIEFSGFRTPYLRRDEDLNRAIIEQKLSYSSNQPIIWDAVDLDLLTPADRKSYLLGLEFYDSWPANEHMSLPSLEHGVVHIPVSLPDDEMLLDRIRNKDQEYVTRVWRFILDETYRRGELFTLQLHPERIAMCSESLSTILSEARQRKPNIWIASMQEIDRWWRRRMAADIIILEVGDEGYFVSVNGDEDLSIQLKNGSSLELGEPIYGGDYLIVDKEFSIQTPTFPGVGLSEELYDQWAGTLKQLGYPLEMKEDEKKYACSISDSGINSWNEVDLVKFIENTNEPILRLNPWPGRNRSALCITGDLDAMTLWDFGFRIFGR